MLIYRTSKNNDTFPHDVNPSNLFLSLGIPVEKIAVLDIETTGFNRSKDIISVVGIILFKMNGDCEVIQLFNDDGQSDHNIVQTLITFLEPIELLVTYNGDGFDLPFLNHKAQAIGLNGILNQHDHRYVRSLDLLKISRELFHYLPRKNLKTIEAELGIGRQDTIDGKEAADSYMRYLKTGSETERDKILLHNVEDILNLIPLLLKLHEKAMIQNPLSFPFTVSIENTSILVESCRIEKDLFSIVGRRGYSTDSNPVQAVQALQADQYSWLLESPYKNKVKALDHMDDGNHIVIKCKLVDAEPFMFINPFDDFNDFMTLKEDQLHTLISKVHDEWKYDTIRLLSARLLSILLPD